MSSETTTTPVEETALVSIRCAAGTDIGKRREENQDSFGIIETPHFRYFVVADGMGGVKGGATASNLAVKVVETMLQDVSLLGEQELCAAIQNANHEIHEKGLSDPGLNGMGTTFVGLAFVGTRLYITNVGDSRAYRFRNGRVKRLTTDHTLIMELLRSGAITPAQADNHPVSHMLTRSLGPTADVEVDCMLCADGPVRGDQYLLCSDGLYNLVHEREFLQILSENSLDGAIQKLIDLANQRGGSDNITIILVELEESFPVGLEDFPADVLDADPGELMTKEPEKAPAQNEQVNGTPASAGADANGHVNGDAGLNGAKPAAESAAQLDAAAASAAAEEGKDTDVAESQPPAKRGSSQFFIGIFGGALLATVIFVGVFSNSNQPPPELPLVRTEAPVPLAAQIARVEVLAAVEAPEAQTRNLQLPEIHLASFSVAGEPQTSESAASGEEQNGTHGLGVHELDNVQRRKETLTNLVSSLDQKLGAFDKPLSSSLVQTLRESENQISALKEKLDGIRSEIDTETRKLAVWYGRRKRIQDADLVNMATEVSVSSTRVKEKKELFEKATWEYLKEVEVLRYNPSDAAQEKKVAELVQARNQRRKELSESVRESVEDAIGVSDERIATLTLERDHLRAQLDTLNQDVDYVKVVTSGDAASKKSKRDELAHKREVALAELEELKGLLPEGASSGQNSATTSEENVAQPSANEAAVEPVIQNDEPAAAVSAPEPVVEKSAPAKPVPAKKKGKKR